MSEEKKEDISKPVIGKPRSFLELLGYHRNEDGTLTFTEELEEKGDE